MNTSLPSFDSYGQYSSNNYGVNTLRFTMPGLTIWYSYKTPVAFQSSRYNNFTCVVRRNDWGPTTGKHLNWIDDGDKDSRIDGEVFERLLAEVMTAHGYGPTQ